MRTSNLTTFEYRKRLRFALHNWSRKLLLAEFLTLIKICLFFEAYKSKHYQPNLRKSSWHLTPFSTQIWVITSIRPKGLRLRPETLNPPMKFPLITVKTASEKGNAAYSLSMNKTFPLNPLSEFEWTSLKTRMNVNLQPPCIHLHAYFISSVKSCIVQLYDAVCFHPSLDWARWNEMEICMLLRNTMPLKIKLWKFFTHFAMLTLVQHLYEIFHAASACKTLRPEFKL